VRGGQRATLHGDDPPDESCSPASRSRALFNVLGAMLLFTLALAALRPLLNKLFAFARRRGFDVDPRTALVFPRHELAVMQALFLPLCRAAGLAAASPCSAFQWVGFTFFVLALCTSTAMLHRTIRKHIIIRPRVQFTLNSHHKWYQCSGEWGPIQDADILIAARLMPVLLALRPFRWTWFTLDLAFKIAVGLSLGVVTANVNVRLGVFVVLFALQFVALCSFRPFASPLRLALEIGISLQRLCIVCLALASSSGAIPKEAASKIAGFGTMVMVVVIVVTQYFLLLVILRVFFTQLIKALRHPPKDTDKLLQSQLQQDEEDAVLPCAPAPDTGVRTTTETQTELRCIVGTGVGCSELCVDSDWDDRYWPLANMSDFDMIVC